jgi:ring-1,2-phenylacetyl-CoA epoxidase subunit PaaC
VRSYFYDEAEHLRLEALEESSYPRIRDRVGKVMGEEEYHREHAENWLRRLVSGEEGRECVQEAVDELFPYALTLFEETEDDEAIDDLGLRTRTLSAMREEWIETVTGTLTEIGIDARTPETDEDGQVSADELPDHVGRDGDHTDHWATLYDEMTNTYAELGRDHAVRLMEDPDDE